MGSLGFSIRQIEAVKTQAEDHHNADGWHSMGMPPEKVSAFFIEQLSNGVGNKGKCI